MKVAFILVLAPAATAAVSERVASGEDSVRALQEDSSMSLPEQGLLMGGRDPMPPYNGFWGDAGRGGSKSGKGSKRGSGSSKDVTCSIEQIEGFYLFPHYPYNPGNMGGQRGYEPKVWATLSFNRPPTNGLGGYVPVPHSAMAKSPHSGKSGKGSKRGSGGHGGWGGWDGANGGMEGYYWDGPQGVMEVDLCSSACRDNPGTGPDVICRYQYFQLTAFQSGFSRGGVVSFEIWPLQTNNGEACGALGEPPSRRRNRRRLLGGSCITDNLCRSPVPGFNACDERRLEGSDGAAAEEAAGNPVDPRGEEGRRLQTPDIVTIYLTGEYDCGTGRMKVGGASEFGRGFAVEAMKADPEQLDLFAFTCLPPGPPGTMP